MFKLAWRNFRNSQVSPVEMVVSIAAIFYSIHAFYYGPPNRVYAYAIGNEHHLYRFYGFISAVLFLNVIRVYAYVRVWRIIRILAALVNVWLWFQVLASVVLVNPASPLAAFLFSLFFWNSYIATRLIERRYSKKKLLTAIDEVKKDFNKEITLKNIDARLNNPAFKVIHNAANQHRITGGN